MGMHLASGWRCGADLRDLNEDYIDFYCSGGEGTVSDEVARELAALGWTWKPYGGG